MMRAARRASLLVAFVLLTSAATAYAECAWVLWTKVTPIDGQERSTGDPYFFEPEAFGRKAECDREARSKVETQEWIRRVVRERSAPPLQTMEFYNCLPDTVDPRGPKGK